MKLSATQVKNYLAKLGVSIIVGDHIDLRTMLPLNIASRYDAIQSKIAGEEYILLFPKSENITPDDIALHNAAVGKALLACPIFALPRLDKEFASSLKAKKIPYLVPSRQVFIPPSIILESDRAYADDEKPLGAHLTPWTQVVLLDCLLHDQLPGAVQFSTLRSRLKITPVNLSRAARELERRGLARTIHPGRDAEIEFSFDKRRIWEKASPVFVSPVRYSIRIKTKIDSHIKSGISALAEIADIVDDPFRTYAIPAKDAKKIPTTKMLRYDGDIVEAWRYDPRLLNEGKDTVDTLSLCIALKNSNDPRIQIAIEKLLEKTLW